MNQRPKQTDCQHEPPYPDHETVLISIRDPDYYMETHKKDEIVEIKKFKTQKQ
jgi:hypothetical protein